MSDVARFRATQESAMQTTRIALVRLTFGLAFAALGAAVTGCGRNRGVPADSPATVEANGQQPALDLDFSAGTKPVLLSADELKERIAPRWRAVELLAVLDVRPRAEYEMGHIPGARHVDIDDWKRQSLAPGGLRDAKAWSQRLGKVGVSRMTYTIVYADQPQDAARIWWTLKYLGVANAAILDGGWKHWLEARGDVTVAIPKPIDNTPPVEFQPERLAEIGDLKQAHAAPGTKIIDARSQEEFNQGRIPGAVRIEWKELLAADGRFKSADELRALFKERGIDEKSTTVTYCQSGGRSALDAFALELAGLPRVKNYYCSWQQWSADGSAPVEK
jgi:thiosulfate/3-mercaptopyruvate sulfurtransferase